MAVGTKIRELRKARGMNQGDLARAAGWDQGNLSRVEKGQQHPHPERIEAIARALNVRVIDLYSDGDTIDVRTQSTGRVPLLPCHDVPQIPRREFAQNPELIKQLLSGTHEQAETFHTRPNPFMFAFRVEGSSMVSTVPGVLSFPEGTLVVIDPTRELRDGDFVLSRLPDRPELTFKRLFIDAGRFYLAPLNPQFATVPLPTVDEFVIGVAVEWRSGGAL